jgi:hypothetical protein
VQKCRRWLRTGVLAAGLVAGLSGCAAQEYADDATQPTLVLAGPSATFTVADQRFAVAAFGPPATLLLMRIGPEYLWATTTPAIRDVYVQELVGDRTVGSHVLEANQAGTVDCTYALRWDGGASGSPRSRAVASR